MLGLETLLSCVIPVDYENYLAESKQCIDNNSTQLEDKSLTHSKIYQNEAAKAPTLSASLPLPCSSSSLRLRDGSASSCSSLSDPTLFLSSSSSSFSALSSSCLSSSSSPSSSSPSFFPLPLEASEWETVFRGLHILQCRGVNTLCCLSERGEVLRLWSLQSEKQKGNQSIVNGDKTSHRPHESPPGENSSETHVKLINAQNINNQLSKRANDEALRSFDSDELNHGTSFQPPAESLGNTKRPQPCCRYAPWVINDDVLRSLKMFLDEPSSTEHNENLQNQSCTEQIPREVPDTGSIELLHNLGSRPPNALLNTNNSNHLACMAAEEEEFTEDAICRKKVDELQTLILGGADNKYMRQYNDILILSPLSTAIYNKPSARFVSGRSSSRGGLYDSSAFSQTPEPTCVECANVHRNNALITLNKSKIARDAVFYKHINLPYAKNEIAETIYEDYRELLSGVATNGTSGKPSEALQSKQENVTGMHRRNKNETHSIKKVQNIRHMRHNKTTNAHDNNEVKHLECVQIDNSSENESYAKTVDTSAYNTRKRAMFKQQQINNNGCRDHIYTADKLPLENAHLRGEIKEQHSSAQSNNSEKNSNSDSDSLHASEEVLPLLPPNGTGAVPTVFRCSEKLLLTAFLHSAKNEEMQSKPSRDSGSSLTVDNLSTKQRMVPTSKRKFEQEEQPNTFTKKARLLGTNKCNISPSATNKYIFGSNSDEGASSLLTGISKLTPGMRGWKDDTICAKKTGLRRNTFPQKSLPTLFLKDVNGDASAGRCASFLNAVSKKEI